MPLLARAIYFNGQRSDAVSIHDGNTSYTLKLSIAALDADESTPYVEPDLMTRSAGTNPANMLYGRKYTSQLSFELSFAKCDASDFSLNEVEQINSWLTKSFDYQRLYLYTDTTKDPLPFYYYCVIDAVDKYNFAGYRILKYKVTCDSPYAWSDKIYNFTPDNNTFEIDTTLWADDCSACYYDVNRKSTDGAQTVYAEVFQGKYGAMLEDYKHYCILAGTNYLGHTFGYNHCKIDKNYPSIKDPSKIDVWRMEYALAKRGKYITCNKFEWMTADYSSLIAGLRVPPVAGFPFVSKWADKKITLTIYGLQGEDTAQIRFHVPRKVGLTHGIEYKS